MSTTPVPAINLDLTLEEQWTVHQAFLSYVEIAVKDDMALPHPTVELTILEISVFELDRLAMSVSITPTASLPRRETRIWLAPWFRRSISSGVPNSPKVGIRTKSVRSGIFRCGGSKRTRRIGFEDDPSG